MFNKKYSSFLTVLLVISIIAIIGIIGFLGFDIFRKYFIDKDAEEAISQFENEINKTQNNTNNNIDVNDVINQLDPSNNGGGNSSNGMMYKGFPMVGTIEIPTINIKYPVLESVTKRSIEVAVAVLSGPGINETGNTIIIGHNYRNGVFFSNLKRLKNGDSIYLTDIAGKKIKYTVYNVYNTTEEDAEYITRDTQGRKEISLSTCTDDGKNRTIIWAKAE